MYSILVADLCSRVRDTRVKRQLTDYQYEFAVHALAGSCELRPVSNIPPVAQRRKVPWRVKALHRFFPLGSPGGR